jgi:hypothetical protein
MWHGLGLLFGLSFVLLIAVTLLTPAESPETLRRFFVRCRPPGFWGPVRRDPQCAQLPVANTVELLVDAAIGILACVCLVMATNAAFVSKWSITMGYIAATTGLGSLLIVRTLKKSRQGHGLLETCADNRPAAARHAADGPAALIPDAHV